MLIPSLVPLSAQIPQVEAMRTVKAHRLSAPPLLDGRVDESWMAYEPAANFVQQLPQEGHPASEPTEVRIGYTREALYFAVICFDSDPAAIRSTQGRRDGALEQTDAFQILIDTYNDDQNGYIFATTAAGIEYDAQIVRGGQTRQIGGPPRAGQSSGSGTAGAQSGGISSFNLNWDGVWRVKTQITERGWEAEFEIPLKTLRFESGGNQAWGVNFMRNLRRMNEQSFWSPVPRAFDIQRVSLAGEMRGVEAKFRRSLQIVPFIMGGVQQDYTHDPAVKKYTPEVGFDAKYTLTSSLTLDFTLNTDFAQVEVDEEQVNLTRFDLFFPEKRPFFLENSGYFTVGTPQEVEMFFSRRIGIDSTGAQIPIVGGVRLSGKQGRYNIGFLNMQTESVLGVAPSNNFTVARLSREFGQRSSVGILAINKSPTGSRADLYPSNQTYGVDANIGLGNRFTWFNYAGRTQTPGRTGNDYAASSSGLYNTDLWRIEGGYTQVGNDFNPEVGFVRRVAYRRPNYGIFFAPRPKHNRYIRRFWPHHHWEGYYRFNGEQESGFRHTDFRIDFNNGGSVGLAFNENFEQLFQPFEISPGIVLPVGRYPFTNWSFYGNTDQSARMYGTYNYAWGDFYSGHIRTLTVGAGMRSGFRYLLSANYVRNDIELPVGNFATDLAILQFTYSFTPKSYLQSLIQYNSTSHQVGVNIRYALIRIANTGLFIVYNSRFNSLGYDPNDPGGLLPPPYRRTLDRAVLAKFTYMFDY
ncbi:MAG: carbohydrate binding family 9 domain-containing protein [Acidobacteria bacterium]|nr:carbohydrate binding family 9 domain-containing protein [Acidobacteriota bacterium]